MADSLFARALVVAFLSLCMLIPLGLVEDQARERYDHYNYSVHNVASLWGESQSLSGPVLAVPYTVTENEADAGWGLNQTRESHHIKLFLPEALRIDAEIQPQIRKRGIYECVVYSSPVSVSGSFRLPGPGDFAKSTGTVRVQWEDAWLAIGLSDLKGVTNVGALRWDGTERGRYSPGAQLGGLLGPGFHIGLELDPDVVAAKAGVSVPFSLNLSINGSGSLFFTPVGEHSEFNLSGPWPHPSFQGNLLPVSREVDEQGFRARWSIPHLSRTYPQSGDFGQGAFKEDSYSIRHFEAGVGLMESVSLYSQIFRAIKYGILFIGLTFVALMIFELATRRRMHLVQYGMVGIAMSLFYLVLLSLAEHVSFGPAYVAASAVSMLMNGLYVASAFGSRRQGGLLAMLLGLLYCLLFALLRMEDYALLMGTVLVCLAVAVLMYMTRKLPVARGRGEGCASPVQGPQEA